MRFIVPKFIDREARILGPLTFKQFLGLAGVGGILFMLYYTLPTSIFIISAIVLVATSFSFIFISRYFSAIRFFSFKLSKAFSRGPTIFEVIIKSP